MQTATGANSFAKRRLQVHQKLERDGHIGPFGAGFQSGYRLELLIPSADLTIENVGDPLTRVAIPQWRNSSLLGLSVHDFR